MAAALIIVGLRVDGQRLLDAFSWGEEFLRLNEEAFEVYSEAKTAKDLRLAEAQLLERWRQEALERRQSAIDLPPERRKNGDGERRRKDDDEGEEESDQSAGDEEISDVDDAVPHRDEVSAPSQPAAEPALQGIASSGFLQQTGLAGLSGTLGIGIGVKDEEQAFQAETQRVRGAVAALRDAAAMHQLLKRASRERHVASTSANERSSRSHAVIQLALVGRCVIPGMQREVSGLLSFVDLAGSERLAHTSATGDRLKEAQHINRSLCALGDVIEAICRKGALSKGGTPSAASSVHVPPTAQRNTTEPMGGEQEADMIFPLKRFL
eukprot:g18884.t1